jgi:hypothetical protein
MKNNLKKLLVLLLAVMLCVTMLAACTNNDDNDDDDIDDDDTAAAVTLTVPNGNFATTTDTGVPAAPSNWTAVGGAVSEKGLINVNSTKYAAYADNASYANWSGNTNPSKTAYSDIDGLDDDDYVLMFHNEELAYGGYKTSSTITLAAGKDYVLRISVKTVDLAGVGARVYLYGSTSIYHQFYITEANQDWTTYEIYLQGNATASKTFTLYLTLGPDNLTPTANGYASGTVYFDNIYLSTIGEEDTKYEDASYDAAVVSADNTVTKTTARVGNAEFDFGTFSASGSTAPGLYSTSNSSNGNNVYRRVDTSASAWTSYSSLYGAGAINPGTPTGSVGNNVYMIYNSAASALTMSGNVALTVERCSIYEISFWVKLYTLNETDQCKATLTLVDSESEEYVLNTTSDAIETWTKYTFFVVGNESTAENLTFKFSFGTGTSTTDTILAAAGHILTA